MAASSPSLPPPPPPTTTLAGNLTASSLLSIPPPRPRLAAAHRRAVVAASASSRPPPPSSPEGDGDEQEVERAMGMDGGIPGTSGEFLRRVSSRAYGMRRHLMESLDSLTYDVLETNPWREDSKPVYVLARSDNLLWTMKTRRSRGEVERELGKLFSNGGGSGIGTKSKYSGSNFNMLVEDIRDGVLVFEDEDDAVRYCDLLEGGGQGCEGIAEIEASSVFNMCRSMKALAVLFRRGSIPPQPQSLERDLRARKRSLED
ncbi:hypothetical protein PR202_gb18701 [Eleusine coracana subsp. coracana]|uniref:Uncharacterized protein n=1 Tax=Eleusine coracana subsp. coracana TaxID=191504 RepID=A0AAV5F6X1_ELECO|nr:hypothetical protein QOZ80_3BG0292960 [Eleusine coracana subsp. coracana]GJN30397.1 hypothetical protein PR202_gb18701 [Eleusine coracana subsp. coracana]